MARPKPFSKPSQAKTAEPSDPPGGSKPAAGLYLVATPIGNLGDITLRALDLLRTADVVACEDSRVTGALLARFGISAKLLPYHDHNAEKQRPRLLAALAQGQVVALVSDAGTPLVSDPGYKLVRDATAAGHAVTALPGASALLAALGVAGLPTDRFLFAGFLDNRSKARRDDLATLAAVPATLIFYESAPRLADSLADMAAVLGDRAAAVARELTKLHEEVRRGGLAALAEHYRVAGPPKGEIVIVVGPPAPAPRASEAEIDALLGQALDRLSLHDAAVEVADVTGESRRAIYARALALERQRK
jgi:16S rRNA (cytidine1402-2'-O)-methyltransferase